MFSFLMADKMDVLDGGVWGSPCLFHLISHSKINPVAIAAPLPPLLQDVSLNLSVHFSHSIPSTALGRQCKDH